MTGSAAESAVTRQAEAAKPEKLGATERLEVISAPGIDELGQAPEVSKSAPPTEKVQFSVWNEEKTALLTETEDGSAALCALPGENLDGGVLLRWDDTLVKFPWRYATNYRAEPKLWLRDMDGDRTKELVVSCQIGGGTGVNYEELHVVKKTENGNLSAYAVPQELWTSLASALKLVENDGRLYAVLGQELVDLSFITEKLEEDNVPERLGCGDWVRFAASAWSDTDIEVEAGVWMAGELLPVLACYVGNVRGHITFRDGEVSLDDLHLDVWE